nr:MAG TPA: hypothetical protein [Caudoviricetes sp.]
MPLLSLAKVLSSFILFLQFLVCVYSLPPSRLFIYHC